MLTQPTRLVITFGVWAITFAIIVCESGRSLISIQSFSFCVEWIFNKGFDQSCSFSLVVVVTTVHAFVTLSQLLLWTRAVGYLSKQTDGRRWRPRLAGRKSSKVCKRWTAFNRLAPAPRIVYTSDLLQSWQFHHLLFCWNLLFCSANDGSVGGEKAALLPLPRSQFTVNSLKSQVIPCIDMLLSFLLPFCNGNFLFSP